MFNSRISAVAIALLIFSALFSGAIGRGQQPTPAPELLDYPQAALKANQSDQPIFVYASSEGCIPCETMWQETLRPMLLDDEFKGIIFGKLQYEKHADDAKKLKIKKTPSILLMWPTKDGWKRARLEGIQSRDRVREFIGLLRKQE